MDKWVTYPTEAEPENVGISDKLHKPYSPDKYKIMVSTKKVETCAFQVGMIQ